MQAHEAASFWERIGFTRRKPEATPTAPIQIEGQTAGKRQSSYLNRQSVVDCLKANPGQREGIIKEYLQSEDLLRDSAIFADFLEVWFREFFQQVDTGPGENLPEYIRSCNTASLPRELQRTKKDIFEPLFKLSDNQSLTQLKEDLRALGLACASLRFAERFLEKNPTITGSLKESYLNFARQLVELEAGLAKPEAINPEELRTENYPHGRSRLQTRRQAKNPPPPQTPTPESNSESNTRPPFQMALRPNAAPIGIRDLVQLTRAMEKIKHLGPVTPKTVWEKLSSLTQMTPAEIRERYGEMVAGGPFEGWRKIALGRKWWIIFKTTDPREINFRVGSHEDVYATARRAPKDHSRRL